VTILGCIPSSVKSSKVIPLALYLMRSRMMHKSVKKKNRVNSNKMVFEMLCTGEDSTSKGIGEINLKGKTSLYQRYALNRQGE